MRTCRPSSAQFALLDPRPRGRRVGRDTSLLVPNQGAGVFCAVHLFIPKLGQVYRLGSNLLGPNQGQVGWPLGRYSHVLPKPVQCRWFYCQCLPWRADFRRALCKYVSHVRIKRRGGVLDARVLGEEGRKRWSPWPSPGGATKLLTVPHGAVLALNHTNYCWELGYSPWSAQGNYPVAITTHSLCHCTIPNMSRQCPVNPILWKDDRLRIVLTVDYHSRWIRPDPNESYLQEGGDVRNVQVGSLSAQKPTISPGGPENVNPGVASMKGGVRWYPFHVLPFRGRRTVAQRLCRCPYEGVSWYFNSCRLRKWGIISVPISLFPMEVLFLVYHQSTARLRTEGGWGALL